MSKRKVVGIDLGTTFSAIAHIDAYGKPQIIPNTETERITPSVIFFDDGLDKLDENQTVFVFDLGGGTFDVTIMRIIDHKMEMIATNGDHRLGGKDWDDVIVNLIAEEFDRLHGENPLLDLHSYQELHNRALAAKIQLSSRNNTTIVYHHDGKSVKLTLTRKEFEKRTRHLVEKCKTICEMVMQEAKMKWDKIDKVLLAGGMTRMPMIRAMISGFSSVAQVDQVNPDEVVARGAAIQGMLSILNDEDISGERTVDDSVRRQFSVLDGGLIEVTDITSHTLGVVLWDERQLHEYVFPMIPKMTPIPAVIKNSFGTADANMQRAVVKVVEGESTVPGECTPLGICDIQLPPYLPKGSPVKLTYQYNANQVLEVEVQAAGNNAKVTIDRNTGLAPQEIEQAASGLGELQVS